MTIEELIEQYQKETGKSLNKNYISLYYYKQWLEQKLTQPVKTCEWKSVILEIYLTECEHPYTHMLTEKPIYCPYCGGLIIFKENEK